MLIIDICAEICKFLATFAVFELYLQPLFDKLLEFLYAIFSVFKKIFNVLRALQCRYISGLIKGRNKALTASNDHGLILSSQGDNLV
jgi:hypothetical protein